MKDSDTRTGLRPEDLHLEEVLSGKMCPYCGAASEYVDSIEVYKTQSYGMMYRCVPCDAHVGTHKGRPREALGRLANQTLRRHKNAAHRAFDPLWKRKAIELRDSGHVRHKSVAKKNARTAAYMWLAGQMNLKSEHCHIGMFNEEQCLTVVELCRPYNRSIK